MYAFKLLAALSSVALFASAAPAKGPVKDCECDVSKAKLDIPSNQTVLVAPTTAPHYVAVGIGYQNYTCSAATSTYACVLFFRPPAPSLPSSTSRALLASQPSPPSKTRPTPSGRTPPPPSPTRRRSPLIGAAAGAGQLLGYHYFVTSPSGSGISPEWDFTSTGKNAGNAEAFVVGAKTGDLKAPTDPTVNVDWLMLSNAEGQLASQIFRVDTVNGQPPASCDPTTDTATLKVKYTAKYYLY
ncbi:hypothetical protein HMN09_00383300 [Mycena chlorophos]|uniref:Malate dehydrogenase n=1 Tax=Mycena chlorophos TaxID=658473 RepID=A0A8H6WNE9_MYCCL|nr:hypothetical protein HMN09_00383300 [Mycena chlorophos]